MKAVVVRSEKSNDGISTMIIGPCRTMGEAMEFCRQKTKRDKVFFTPTYPSLIEESGENYYSLDLGGGNYLRYEAKALFPTKLV